MTALNPKQQEAVEALCGPVLIIAGAGSGKSRVVTARIARLIEKGVSPERILGVTFPNKAAKEMQTRVQKLTSSYVLISTFHSLGARILRESIGALGLRSDFAIYDEDDVQKTIRSILQTLDIKDKTADVKTCRAFISNAKGELLLPEEIVLKRQDPRLITVYQEYLKRMREAQALDFDDLLFLTVRLFRQCQEEREKWQSCFDFVLVDEYQDTNQAQYEMCQILVARHRNFFVVGDPDQMIYSWRGAKIETILHCQKDYPEAQVIYLEQNYRSSPTILEGANALIRHNKNRLEKNLWSGLHAGEKIQIFSAMDEKQEARFVAREILRLHQEGHIPFEDMAIFYRTNAQSRAFEDILLGYQIPYVIVGGISFYQRKEIKDLLAFLRLINNESDFVSFARTINLPKRGIGDATLEKIRLAASQQQIPLLQCLASHSVRLTAKQREALASYLQLILGLKEKAKTLSLQELVEEIIHSTGYLDILKQDPETLEDRQENINELIAKAATLSKEGATLEIFLEELSLKSSLDMASDAAHSLSLMTLHNGKGLEFEAVFLTGLEEHLLPHVNGQGEESSIEEERRLCYVGMTRAKQFLFITHAIHRFLFGSERRQYPSRFLREIPLYLTQRVK